ncbi:MAG: hypothetical protein LBL87_02405 [Ruminococcus sp.]|jgi:hypothetical protein|nr:hypothetical protein [Ruminococcus sp.]
MKKTKIAAIFAAAVITLTGCGADTRFAGTINGEEIPAGVYIYEQMQAFYEAYTSMSAEDQQAATPIFEAVIDGVPSRQWIADKTVKNLREYAAVNEKFAALGLGYSTDDNGIPMDQLVDESIDYSWEEGIAPTLTPFGISKESYRLIQLNAVKRQELFEYYYGVGGEKEVPEEEIKKYLSERFAHIDYFEMPLRDGEGNLLKSDGKTERMDMAKDYVARAESGEDFNEIMGQYNDWYAELTKTAADETAEAADAAAADPQASPEDEAPPTNDVVITKDSANPSAEVDAKVFEYQAANPDFTAPQYFIVEAANGETYWVVKLIPLFENTSYFEDNRESAVYEMKNEEFSDLIDIWTRDQSLILNEKAVARYQPDMFTAEES